MGRRAVYLDYGFVRLIVMNSNDKIYEQGKWLEQVLSETEGVGHYPIAPPCSRELGPA